MTQSRIESATFRLVVQCLNQERHRLPHMHGINNIKFANTLYCVHKMSPLCPTHRDENRVYPDACTTYVVLYYIS